MDEDTENTDSNVSVVVAGLLLLPAIYVAFWVLDWDLLVAKIAFVIVVPSVLGNLAAAIASR